MKLSFAGNKIHLMGILNITSDSFSDGGDYFGDVTKAVERAQMMLRAGADIIDIGGQSTRPGAKEVSTEEELDRVIPVVRLLKEKLGENIYLSIDTYRAEVAQKSLERIHPIARETISQLAQRLPEEANSILSFEKDWL